MCLLGQIKSLVHAGAICLKVLWFLVLSFMFLSFLFSNFCVELYEISDNRPRSAPEEISLRIVSKALQARSHHRTMQSPAPWWLLSPGLVSCPPTNPVVMTCGPQAARRATGAAWGSATVAWHQFSHSSSALAPARSISPRRLLHCLLTLSGHLPGGSSRASHSSSGGRRRRSSPTAPSRCQWSAASSPTVHAADEATEWLEVGGEGSRGLGSSCGARAAARRAGCRRARAAFASSSCDCPGPRLAGSCVLAHSGSCARHDWCFGCSVVVVWGCFTSAGEVYVMMLPRGHVIAEGLRLCPGQDQPGPGSCSQDARSVCAPAWVEPVHRATSRCSCDGATVLRRVDNVQPEPGAQILHALPGGGRLSMMLPS